MRCLRGVEPDDQVAFGARGEGCGLAPEGDSPREQVIVAAWPHGMVARVQAFDALALQPFPGEPHGLLFEPQRPHCIGVIAVREFRGYDRAREVQDGRRHLVRELRIDEDPPVEAPRVSLRVVGDRHRAFAARADGLPAVGGRGAAAGGLHAGDDERCRSFVMPFERVARRRIVLADMPCVDLRALEAHGLSPVGRGGVRQAVEFGTGGRCGSVRRAVWRR